MTIEQMRFALELIKKFESQRQGTNQDKMESLIDRVRYYFKGLDFSTLFLNTYQYGADVNTQEDFISDCNTMIYTLKGMLDEDKNYSKVKTILKDIESYKKSSSQKAIENAVKQIYYSYSGEIKFVKVIETSINALNNPLSVYSGIDKSMLNGMIVQLEKHAIELCNGKGDKSVSKAEKMIVNFTNNNANTTNVSQTTNVNIELEIDNAKQQVLDEGLSKIQENEVLEKLDELKQIVNSKESKGKRWAKLGNFFKWVAEQGIQVAGIIVPLLAKAM